MGTKEKNKKGLSIAKVYLSKQILIILCIVAVVLVAWFGTRKVVSIDNKTTKLGFENIGELDKGGFGQVRFSYNQSIQSIESVE